MKLPIHPTFTPARRSFWSALVCLLPGLLTLQSASALTLKPIADTRTSTSGVLSAANTADVGVGVITATNFTRTYLAYDLSALTAADTAVTVKLGLFNTGGEANTNPTLPQVYTLFQVSSNWAGTPVPGPEGTALATINITPSVGTDTKDIEFTSPELVTAFNNAIGSILYLGIKSDKEGTAARSFTFFNSTEDPGREPYLISSTTLPAVISVSVPDSTMSEPGTDTATFTLSRTVDTASTLTVFYTLGGTATNNDYTVSSPGSVTFAPGVTSVDVVITPINDVIAERLETVILTVTSNAAYSLGTPSTGTATLADDNDDDNNVLLRYIFTDANAITSVPSREAQVYSPEVSATAITAAEGISVGNSGVTVSAPNAGYINSEDTASTAAEAIANDDYFFFTITPAFGKSLTLTELELSGVYTILTSAGLRGTLFVRSSIDNYETDLAVRTFTRSDPYAMMSIPLGAAFTQFPNQITFRVYVYDDVDVAQDGMRIDDVFVRGSAEPLPPGVQQVIIEATDSDAAEPFNPGVFTITRAGAVSAPVTVNYSIEGTALNGTDYNQITNQVTLAAGESSATVTIMPIDELTLEGTETVTLTLTESNDHTVFTPRSATVTVVDDEAVSLRPSIGTLTLDPATTTYNRLTVTITAEGDLTATDTKTTDASGTLIASSDTDVNTGATLKYTLMTNGSTVAMTPMSFNLRAIGVSVATFDITNMAGTAFTDLPPGAVNPTGNGATFDASLHRLLVNQGDIIGQLTIPFEPSEPIDDDFVSSPLSGLGSGTATLTMTPTSRTQTQQFFNAVMTMPVDFTQEDTISGTPVTIRVQGTIRASGTMAALLDQAGEIASWDFNAGSTSTSRRALSNVVPEATASALDFNASFTDVGVNVAPSAPNDGFGFGTNNGDLTLRLRRAAYLDTSAVPDPRPTEQAYSSWGDGASAGTGATLSANGNAPIAFTVTANASIPIILSSLTIDWTSGDAISFQFQEAGANPGPSVTASGEQNTRFTVPLASQVIIEPGQSKTFTLNLNNEALDTGGNIDSIVLNGALVSGPAPDPFLAWSQATGLTGVNDDFADNPDMDAFPNGLEWVLGGTTPLATDRTGVGTTGELLNMAVESSGNLVFTFRRIDESEGQVVLKVLFSNDLFVADNREVTVGTSGPQGTPPAGVTVQIIENGAAPDTITVTIPGSYAGANQRLFGRLQATRL